MSEPHIGVFRERGASGWTWQCSYPHTGRNRWSGYGAEPTASKAADAGREHMRRYHYDKEAVMFAALDAWAADHPELDEPRYSRACGVSLAACEAQTCRCEESDGEPVNGRQEAVQRCGYCGHPVGEHLGRWCRHITGAIKADGRKRICCCEGADRDWPDDTGPIAHDNPLQTAHNGSRSDA